MEKQILTIEDVQELLSVGRDWIYARMKSGQLPYLKMGHYIRFKHEDIKALLERSREQVSGEEEDGHSIS